MIYDLTIGCTQLNKTVTIVSYDIDSAEVADTVMTVLTELIASNALLDPTVDISKTIIERLLA